MCSGRTCCERRKRKLISPQLAALRAYARQACAVELENISETPVAGRTGQQGFYFADKDYRALGKAISWATRDSLESLAVFAEPETAGQLRRRQGLLEKGSCDITLWSATAEKVVPAVPSETWPQPTIPAGYRSIAESYVEPGMRIVAELGQVSITVAGLEIGRVVAGEEAPEIEVGVGQADRELHQLVHSSRSVGDSLAAVAETVQSLRSVGSHHPLTRLARPRWLRSCLLDDPGKIHLHTLGPLPQMRPSESAFNELPTAALGEDSAGQSVIVVCSVGADLDVAIEAADYRMQHAPEAKLLLVMPEIDISFVPAWSLNQVPNIEVIPFLPPWQVR